MTTTHSTAWLNLQNHRNILKNQRLVDWFATQDQQSPNRAQQLTKSVAGLSIDFSRNLIQAETLNLFGALAQEQGFTAKRTELFQGAKLNNTENRAAWHTALRGSTLDPIVSPELPAAITQEIHKMKLLAHQLSQGSFTDVINIGIGGSDLGPKLVYNALAAEQTPLMQVHYLSNIDGVELSNLLKPLNPATTLVLVCSKTFTTQETLLNASCIKDWFCQRGHQDKITNQFIGLTANPEQAIAWGILPTHVLRFWDWVGGRYSIWSSVGFSVALAFGFETFENLLVGAHLMDEHFIHTDLIDNIPFILGCLTVWYSSFCHYPVQMIAPYYQGLALLGNYLQQLEMESNGKAVSSQGKPLLHSTVPAIMPQVGTDCQHAVFQWLHQSAFVTPIDFIAVLKVHSPYQTHQQNLLANCFAQSTALMYGIDQSTLAQKGVAQHLLPHRAHTGNRPSTSILMDQLTAKNLGALIAAYEHKVFTASILWGINPFDQYGVEYGKEICKSFLSGQTNTMTDSSTQAMQSILDNMHKHR